MDHDPAANGQPAGGAVAPRTLWQHRRHYVANTRWWPPFCLVVDWVAAAVLIVLITVGVPFHP
jgi:hypothetical protein